MRIYILQHEAPVNSGAITPWAIENGHRVTTTLVSKDQNFLSHADYDLLMILGGTMGAFEDSKFPWLTSEKTFIREAINSGKCVLGICLGSQLIAETMGGKAYKHSTDEIGWINITRTQEGLNEPLFGDFPDQFSFFEFHMDTFDLPPNFINIAQSNWTKNQIYVYDNRVVGIQGHPEIIEPTLNVIAEAFPHLCTGAPNTQKPEEFLNKPEKLKNAQSLLFSIINKFASRF